MIHNVEESKGRRKVRRGGRSAHKQNAFDFLRGSSLDARTFGAGVLRFRFCFCQILNTRRFPTHSMPSSTALICVICSGLNTRSTPLGLRSLAVAGVTALGMLLGVVVSLFGLMRE